MKSYYMAVTADRFELPIAVADSPSTLAKRMGTTRTAINSKIQNYKRMNPKSDHKSGRHTDYWVVKVESDE